MKEWKRKWKLLEGLGFRVQGGNEGVEKNLQAIKMGYIGITMRIHSFIPS